MRTIFLFAFIFLFLQQAHSQSKIRIKDKHTGESIPYAHIMLFDLKQEDSVRYHLSDDKGEAVLFLKKASIIHISYVGFKTILDTVLPNNDTCFLMEPDVFNLDAFVVTASCEPQMADKSIYKIQVISKKDINYKGANNLNELLNNQLNMKIDIDPSLGAGISLQGLSGEHVKFLIDGVPVVGRKNGTIDLIQINLNQVDHVEIIEGPMSVVYGSNALAGVINVITKPSSRKKLNLHANTYYESVGVYNVDGGFQWTQKKHNFRGSILRNFFDGFTQTPDLRKVPWKPKRQINGDLAYNYSGLKHQFRLSFSLFDELLQDKGNLLAPYYETAFDQYYNTTRTSNMADYTWKINPFYTLNILGSYSTYNWHKNTYFKDLTTLSESITTNPDQHDSTGVNAWLSRGILSFHHEERALNFQLGYDFNLEEASGKRIDGAAKSIGDYAAFLSLNYKGIKHLKLQPGIRYSYNTRYQAPLVYSLNAQFKRNDLSFRLSAAKGFRAPSIKELYLDFQDINHNIFGNPDLLAENSINFNGSINYLISKGDHSWSLNTSAYHNTINNIITLALLSGGAYSYTNLNQYITKGINLGLRYSFYPRINLDVNGGILGIYNQQNKDIGQKDFLYSPSITANFEYFFSKAKIRWNSFYKYTGKLPQVAVDEDGNVFESHIQSYNTLESSLSKSFFKNRLTVVAGGKNLFNNTTLPSTSASGGSVHGGGGNIPIGWGRSFFVKVSYNFVKY